MRNKPLEMAKQRVAIMERIMKLPYIKATRDTERGEERFVCRDDVITAVHEHGKAAKKHDPNQDSLQSLSLPVSTLP
jgi:hypothetical protein